MPSTPENMNDGAMDEMIEGYFDGRDHQSPSPGPNRSDAYTHGFANGRDDLAAKPRASAALLREQADEILARARSGDR